MGKQTSRFHYGLLPTVKVSQNSELPNLKGFLNEIFCLQQPRWSLTLLGLQNVSRAHQGRMVSKLAPGELKKHQLSSCTLLREELGELSREVKGLAVGSHSAIHRVSFDATASISLGPFDL